MTTGFKHTLRNVTDEDHEWLVELHNDPIVLRNMTHPNPITLKHHLGWWSKIKDDNAQLRLIYQVNDVRAGFTKFYSIDHVNKNCVLGADLHQEWRGKGLAKHMWTLMLNKCFVEFGMHRVSLTTAEYNDVAIRVYESLGFKKEGELKQSLFRDNVFYDQICMYMLKESWSM